MNTCIFKAATAVFVLCLFMQRLVTADEIIISGNEHAVTVGDFDFSPCNTESYQGALSVLSEGSSTGEMTAGDLWQFFSDKGINSVENLTICMDWVPGQELSSDIDVSSLRLKIEDPSCAGSLITNASLGGHSLVVPGFEVSSFKPEAKLDVALGYDFMKCFGPESKEKIQLGFDETPAGIPPTFSFDGSAASPGRIPNWFGLVGFVLFWLIVFRYLAKLTAPKEIPAAPVATPKPSGIISA